MLEARKTDTTEKINRKEGDPCTAHPTIIRQVIAPPTQINQLEENSPSSGVCAGDRTGRDVLAARLFVLISHQGTSTWIERDGVHMVHVK